MKRFILSVLAVCVSAICFGEIAQPIRNPRDVNGTYYSKDWLRVIVMDGTETYTPTQTFTPTPTPTLTGSPWGVYLSQTPSPTPTLTSTHTMTKTDTPVTEQKLLSTIEARLQRGINNTHTSTPTHTGTWSWPTATLTPTPNSVIQSAFGPKDAVTPEIVYSLVALTPYIPVVPTPGYYYDWECWVSNTGLLYGSVTISSASVSRPYTIPPDGGVLIRYNSTALGSGITITSSAGTMQLSDPKHRVR